MHTAVHAFCKYIVPSGNARCGDFFSSNWGLWHQKLISQAGIINCIPWWSVGCNYLSLPEKPASGTKAFKFKSFKIRCATSVESKTNFPQKLRTHFSWKYFVKKNTYAVTEYPIDVFYIDQFKARKCEFIYHLWHKFIFSVHFYSHVTFRLTKYIVLRNCMHAFLVFLIWHFIHSNEALHLLPN